MNLSHALEAWKRPGIREGIATNFHRWRVVRHEKVLLAMPKVKGIKTGIENQEEFCIVAYPHPQHMREFAQASLGLRGGGWADVYPCSIGVIGLKGRSQTVGRDTKHWLSIEFAQAHYRTGTHEGALPRSLATRYAGWRKRAFTEVAKLAKRHKFEIWIGRWTLLPREEASPESFDKPVSQFHKEILEVCRELGLKTQAKVGGVLVNPQN